MSSPTSATSWQAVSTLWRSYRSALLFCLAALMSSPTSAASWQAVSTPWPSAVCPVRVGSWDDGLYALHPSAGLFFSPASSAGLEWSARSTGLPGGLSYHDYVIVPGSAVRGPQRLFLATNAGVFVNEGADNSFTSASKGLPAGSTVLSLAWATPSASGGNSLLIAGLQGAALPLWYSSDNGLSWSAWPGLGYPEGGDANNDPVDIIAEFSFFIVSRQGTLFSSPDLMHWAAVSAPASIVSFGYTRMQDFAATADQQLYTISTNPTPQYNGSTLITPSWSAYPVTSVPGKITAMSRGLNAIPLAAIVQGGGVHVLSNWNVPLRWTALTDSFPKDSVGLLLPAYRVAISQDAQTVCAIVLEQNNSFVLYTYGGRQAAVAAVARPVRDEM